MRNVLLLLAILLAPSSSVAEEQEPAESDSVSCGRVNRGGLAAAATLELEGPGYLIPEPWRTRGLRYGTQELVGLIRRAAAAVEREHPGARLGVADLSRRRGGSAAQHRSHQSGRDVDLIYFALDGSGQPVAPGGCMPSYRPDRTASCCYSPKKDVAPRRFDVARNWALVKAMLTDEHARVRVIFMSLGVRNWLLEHAARLGEPRALIRRAEDILMRPPGARAHTDHMHVRIACTLDDRRRGRCKNDPDPRGRWFGRIRCPRRTVTTAAR
jgi:penicillin-insensitive murein endopeptidase